MPDGATRQALIQAGCWLCRRPLGRRIQWHHPVPKSRGGRQVVPIHPICHSTLHATFTNRELGAIAHNVGALRQKPEIAEFLRWIDGKPADFYAPTRRRKN